MFGFNPAAQRKDDSKKKKPAFNSAQLNPENLTSPDADADFAGSGMIYGAGTGTSDDIKTQMPAGSYVMPADSTAAIGEQSLSGLGAAADVRVSNGEYQMPPEQVHAVGAQVLDQMKSQTQSPSGKGFSPDVGRNGEQFFSQGGLVKDPDEAKRKASQTYGLAPMGIGLTPQMADANRRSEQRKGGAQAIQQTKENISGAVGQAATSAYNSAKTIPRLIQNTTFDDRLPRQDFRDAQRKEADSARAKKWASSNPDAVQSAGLGMQGVADRATTGLHIPPQPLQGIGGAPMPTTQQPAQAQLAQQNTTQQPAASSAAEQPAALPVQAAPQVDSTQVVSDDTQGSTDVGYADRTDRERRDFARSNKVDGVPTLTSEMAKTIDPSSINTMSSQAMSSGVSPRTSQALSGALSAAAERGDWQAVNNYYQSQGQSFGGMGAGGLSGSQGTRVTVVKDPTRMPSNAEIVNQRMESARMRNADTGRKTDIAERGAAAGISSQQLQDAMREREYGISERRQNLAERQAEPSIAQQQRLQALYAEYDQADDAGKIKIAQQIRQLSGETKPLKDNFSVVGGGQEWDPQGGVMRNVPQRLIDLRTGQEVVGGQSEQQEKPLNFKEGEVLRHPKTGARYRVVNGQPVEIKEGE